MRRCCFVFSVFLVKSSVSDQISWRDFIENKCGEDLGLQDNTLPDKAFQSSGHHKSKLFMGSSWHPSDARLHNSGMQNCWMPKDQDKKQWLQIGFDTPTVLTAMGIQGGARY